MKLPIIAICGRPNVGKSTLFNKLSGRLISIEDPTSGVTRDRISSVVQYGEHYFELVDTGGIGIIDNQRLEKEITQQINLAIEKADLILFLVDIKDGILPLDQKVADILRHSKRFEQVWLIANKTDYSKLEMEKENFRRLGFGSPICVSAKELYGIEELKGQISSFLEKFPIVKPSDTIMKIAVVGRPNCGKSTFINSLAKEERMIVSEQAGTTRDSVDIYFEKDGKTFMAIDTAGIKRRKSIADNVEYYSQHRSQRSIRRADVVIFMIDATAEITNTDKEIAKYISDENKVVIIVLNKWDLVKNIPTENYQDYIDKLLPTLYYAPISFISAKNNKNIQATIDLAINLCKQASQRVGTGELNRIIRKIITKRSPEWVQGRQGKIYFVTQTEVLPPTFIFFVNEPKLFTPAYQRYLANQIRKYLRFSEVPVRLVFKEREHSTEKEKSSIPNQDLTINPAYNDNGGLRKRGAAVVPSVVPFESEKNKDLDQDIELEEHNQKNEKDFSLAQNEEYSDNEQVEYSDSEESYDEEYSNDESDEEYSDDESDEEYSDDESDEEYSDDESDEEDSDDESDEEYSDDESDEEYSDDESDEEYSDDESDEEYSDDESDEDKLKNISKNTKPQQKNKNQQKKASQGKNKSQQKQKNIKPKSTKKKSKGR